MRSVPAARSAAHLPRLPSSPGGFDRCHDPIPGRDARAPVGPAAERIVCSRSPLGFYVHSVHTDGRRSEETKPLRVRLVTDLDLADLGDDAELGRYPFDECHGGPAIRASL